MGRDSHKGLKLYVSESLKSFVRWVNVHTGYTEDQLRGGLQLAVGLFILMVTVSTPRVWNALSLDDSFLNPIYAIVSFCVVLQPNLGTAFQFVLMRAMGALVGGLLGLLSMYITFAANGSSYHNSTTKGAVMVTLLSLFAFGMGLLRFRYSRYWFAFVVATFSMPMVALNSFWLPFVQYKALFYWWLQVALGVGVAALVSVLVAPITAGHKVRKKTQDSLHGLGELTSAVAGEMLLKRLREDGLLHGVQGKLEGPHAIDTGLKEHMVPLYDLANNISANIESVRVLLKATATEYDVYHSTHIFPVEPYDLLKSNIRAYLSSVMMLVYPLQSGKLSLRAVQAFEREIRLAGKYLAKSLSDLADCIDGSVKYKLALKSLRELEHHWRTLGALCPSPEDGWSENDILTCDMVVAVLFNLGTRVRRMYLTMPDAIKGEQPDCRAAASRHFKASAVWDMLPPHHAIKTRALQRTSTPVSSRVEASLPSQVLSPMKAHDAEAATAAGAARQGRFLRSRSRARLVQEEVAHQHQQPVQNGIELDPVLSRSLPPGKQVELGERFPPLQSLPPIQYSLLEAALRFIHRTTGFNDQHISLALQLGVAIAAASILHVDENSYVALREKTIWAAVTVCVVFESSLGGIILKSTMRMIGTLLAGVVGVGLLYLAVLINGGNYQNNPGKFISMSVFLPLVLGFVMMNHMRVPHQYAYSLSVGKFTTPIIALSGYSGTKVAWDVALWRLCNIATGIGIDLAATMLIFPVTGRRATRQKIQETVCELASLSEAVLNQFVSGPSFQAASPLGTPRVGRGSLSRSSTLDTATLGFRTPERSISGDAPCDIEMGVVAPKQEQQSTPDPSQRSSPQQAQQAPHPSPRAAQEAQQLSPQGAQHAQQLSPQEAQQVQQQDGPLAGAYPSMMDLVEEGNLLQRDERSASQQGQHADQLRAQQEEVQLPMGYPSLKDLVVVGGPGGVYPTLQRRKDTSRPSGSAAADVAGANTVVDMAHGILAPLPEAGEEVAGAGLLWGGLRAATHTSTGQSQEPLLTGEGGPSAVELAAAGAPVGSRLPHQQQQQHHGSGTVTATVEGWSTPPRSPSLAAGPGAAAQRSPDHQHQLLPPLHIPPRISSVGGKSSQGGGTTGVASAGGSTFVTPTRTLSDVSAGFLSVTPKNRRVRAQRRQWMQRHVLGRVFVTIHEYSVKVASLINEMNEVVVFSKYEWDPFNKQRRLPQEDIRGAQRSCRKMLNVLLSFAYVLDAPDIPHLLLLAPFKEEVQVVAAQMRACLEALSHVVGGHVPIHTALSMMSNLALQVQLLLLKVEQGAVPPDATEADVVLGYASLGVLFSAMQTVQVLYRSVVKLLCPPSDLEAVDRSFEQTAAWGASMEALLVAQGVVLSHLVSDTNDEIEVEEEMATRMVD